MIHIKKIVALLSFYTLALGLPLAHAGNLPPTALQYPEWSFVMNTPFTGTSNAASTEVNFAQVTVPGQSLGNNGAMHISIFVSTPDKAPVTDTWIGYIGGSGTGSPPTGATPIFTNTFQKDNADKIYQEMFLQGSNNAVYCTQWTTTNSLGFTKVNKTFDTSTNFLFTVTGQAGYATNILTLDGLQLKIQQMP